MTQPCQTDRLALLLCFMVSGYSGIIYPIHKYRFLHRRKVGGVCGLIVAFPGAEEGEGLTLLLDSSRCKFLFYD